jgi:glycolate oxidase iron-sulfur subunit
MRLRHKKQGIADLARMMKSLDQEVSRCSRCGMCQAVCPVYGLTGHEKDTARGKLALLDGLMREMFSGAEGTASRLKHCLLCGSCGTGCPMNIDTAVVFLRARGIIESYRRLAWWKRMLFRRLVARPARFDRFLAWASWLQFLALRRKPVHPQGPRDTVASLRFSDRRVIPLAPVPFHARKREKTEPEALVSRRMSASPPPASAVRGPRVRVAFFVGCLLDKVFPDTAENIVGTLEKHGAAVIIPDGQGCCGMPVLAGGDREAFSRLMVHNLASFDPDQFDYLVTGCATCTAAIKKFWPEMTADHAAAERRQITTIADKTHDISEFLVNVLGASDAGLDAKQFSLHDDREIVTWHDPCHLAKTLGIRDEPRRLIRCDPARGFQEMPDADACCGMGGSFNLQYYGESAAIGSQKVDAIRASGASVVATGCPACMIQLTDMLARADLPVSVRHVIDLVAERK